MCLSRIESVRDLGPVLVSGCAMVCSHTCQGVLSVVIRC